MAEIWSSPVCPGAIQVKVEHLEHSCSASIVIIMTVSYVYVSTSKVHIQGPYSHL